MQLLNRQPSIISINLTHNLQNTNFISFNFLGNIFIRLSINTKFVSYILPYQQYSQCYIIQYRNLIKNQYAFYLFKIYKFFTYAMCVNFSNSILFYYQTLQFGALSLSFFHIIQAQYLRRYWRLKMLMALNLSIIETLLIWFSDRIQNVYIKSNYHHFHIDYTIRKVKSMIKQLNYHPFINKTSQIFLLFMLLSVSLILPKVGCGILMPQQQQISTKLQNNSDNSGQSNINNQQLLPTNNPNDQGNKPNICVQFNQGGGCTKCSFGYYLNPQSLCSPVNPLCKQSNNQGDCIKCYEGYILKTGKCLSHSLADPSCKSFVNGVCNQCFSGFFYNQQTKSCRKVNPLCKKWNSQGGACTDCYNGYALNIQKGTCQLFIKDPNCKQRDSSGFKCQECIDRYYLNKAIGVCSSVNIICKGYDKYTGDCTQCYTGYKQRKGTCIIADAIDNRCRVFQVDDTCSECFDGFYTGPQGKCQSANPICKTYNKKNGYCTSCYDGYGLDDAGSCVVKQIEDKFCSKFSKDKTKCQECYGGYTIVEGICKQQELNCKKSNPSEGCLQCWQGYELANKECRIKKVLQVAQNNIYCIKYENGRCTACSQGYYNNKQTKKCQQVSSLCNGYDKQNGKCSNCYGGYKLQDGKCISEVEVMIPYCQQAASGTCKQCIHGYYLSNNQCKAVSILCSTYDKFTGKCYDCIPGYFFQQNQCIFPAIFDANCIRYEGGFCSKCRQGFYVNNFSCKPVDPNCFVFDYNYSVCQSCVNGLSPKGQGCQ